jgi:hypothetical protein
MSDQPIEPFNSDPSAVSPAYGAAGQHRDPVPCPLCEQSFVMRIDLEAHLLAVHGVTDKAPVKRGKTTKRKRAHYNPTSQATSFKGAFVAFMVVILFGTIVIGIANPGTLKVLLPAVLIVDAAIFFGLVRR